ncbi:oligosaccharide flippase family protein [Pseudoalteromonas sp. NZS11]|uniref:oligosaccharide flippase family protein n=1 Tax=Pseudoalteromonas sp. NZS11 TaxID=2792049 RepID=UPI0018CFD7BE|nr:oligosaccharide flippase family protein [Pseudoalteromonas sp. NZS11]MBH0080944.1 oligosaccharide flippase family protein [Pseudoalteromonas sp. NZS11]
MSEKKSVSSGIGTMAVLTISSKLVRLVILMITARFLTPEDFGVVAAFTMVFAFAYLITDMGIIRTLIQRPVISDKHVGSALVLSISLCVLICLSLFLFADDIANQLNVNEIALSLKISGIIFLLLGFSNICSALFQRSGDVVFIGKLQALGTVTGNIFVTVPLLYFDIGFWSIIIGLWVSELISVVFILLRGWKILHFKVYKTELTEIIKYATAFFFNSTLGLLSQQIDIAIISKMMGSTALGFYSRAMQLVEFPNQVYWLVVDRVVFPVMSAMKDDKEKLSQFFLQSLSLLSLALTIGSLILVVGADQIVLIMMGEQWGEVASILEILGLCIIFRALASFMDSFIAAYDLIKLLTIKQIVSLLILVTAIWFGADYGVLGVAYAVVITSAMRFLLTVALILSCSKVRLIQILKVFIPSVITPLTIFVVYLCVSEVEILQGLFGIIIAAALVLSLCIVRPFAFLTSSTGKKLIDKNLALIRIKS